MNYRSQLHADQLLVAGSLESQVDNLWFLPIEPFNEAHHVLTLSIDVSETLMNCNLQGVEVNKCTRLSLKTGVIGNGICMRPNGICYY